MKLNDTKTKDIDLTDKESIHIQAFEDDGDNKSNYYFRLGQEGWTTDGCFKNGLKFIDDPEAGCL